MCREMEELYNEAMEIGERNGEKRGEMKKAKETVQSLSQMGLEIELIAQAVKVSVNQTREWIEEAY